MKLLLDALDQTLADPRSAPRWHRLVAAWCRTQQPQARRQVLTRLAATPLEDAASDVLRLSFMAGAGGEPALENAAAARVLQVAPTDPDRLAAFMAYRWLGALQRQPGRAEFVAELAAGQLPEMAERLRRCAAAQLPAGFLPRLPNAIRRIAIVAPYIGHRFHTPSVMAVDQGALLAAQGCNVQLFAAQELRPANPTLYRGDAGQPVLPALDAEAWGRLLPPGMRMTLADARLGLAARWRQLLPALRAFDPDVVLLVGLYSPLAAALHALRPLVGLSVNTVPPLAPLDVWLSADEDAAAATIWAERLPPPAPLFHPYRLKRPQHRTSLTREDFGLAPDQVVWITAGFRLEQEIGGAWAQRMLELMACQPQAVWLLVGGSGALPAALRDAPPDRVRALPTRDDLPDLLRICDVYVNPPRMGGGISVAEAMAEGLAVATLGQSDGGDKVGELAQPDLAAYFALLQRLCAEPALRAELGAGLRRRFDRRFALDASGPALLAACGRAAQLAAPRLTRPS